MAKTGTGKYGPAVTALREQISGGDLAPGDWLPSETTLMEQFGVTRYSAREAIKRLASDGLVVVVDGKGSYVRPRPDRARHHDTRTLEQGNRGLHDAELDQWSPVEEPATYRANAGVDLALTLGVAEHTPMFGHERLMAQIGERGAARRMLHRLHVPITTSVRVPVLSNDPFVTPDALYIALHAAEVSFTITEHVRAVAPAPDDTTSLALPLGATVLVTRRIIRDDEGRALAMEETRRSAEDTLLVYAITPPTPASAPARARGRGTRQGR